MGEAVENLPEQPFESFGLGIVEATVKLCDETARYLLELRAQRFARRRKAHDNAAGIGLGRLARDVAKRLQLVHEDGRRGLGAPGKRGQFMHRRLALSIKAGQHVAMRRRKALQARRRQFGDEPAVRALMRQRKKMCEVLSHFQTKPL